MSDPLMRPSGPEDLPGWIALANPNPILAVDLDGRITFWNSSMELITRRPAREALGQPIHDVFPGFRAHTEDPALSRLLRWDGERAFSSLGAPSRLFEAEVLPISGGGGPVSGAVAILKDVTESRRVEEERSESEYRFRTMADGAPVLLWMADVSGLCTFFNQGWLDFTGRTFEQEVGNGWAENVHPEDFQHCMTVYFTAFVERLPFRMEYRLRRADGQYRWVLDTGRPRLAADGTFEGYIGSCIDITEMRDAAATLRKLNSELEERVEQRTAELLHANAELEAFSYSVSHDLRAPLRAIDGYSAILASSLGELTGESRHALERIRGSSQRMAELIDGLLGLSRLSRAEMHLRPVDLSALAISVSEELRAASPDRPVECVVAPGLSAAGDPRLLRIVLSNLMGNAWKFTSKRSNARIEFGAEDRNGVRAFFVRDNGAGFDMQYVEKLFRAFQRLHRASDFEGTGIGLATVQRILNRHGGRIWAEGKTDEGATFYFTL